MGTPYLIQSTYIEKSQSGNHQEQNYEPKRNNNIKTELVLESFDEDNEKDMSTSEEIDINEASFNEEYKVLDESNLAEKPKLLVQRVFHQYQNHVVEPKLDFVVAQSESEITKHVFGGLFTSKYYPYVPDNYCRKHEPDLFEFEDETLPKIGDKFDSLESFRLYIDGKARQWKYYLKCADSHRKNGKDTFVFRCVFAKCKSYISKAKGLRKRIRKVPLHDCPCRVLVKPVPLGAKDLTVIYVCNHHDHPLSDDYFCKLQHGRRLHPRVKEELMDLLSLNVEKVVVKKYFKLMTGYSMNNGFFANMLFSMKKKNIKREFSLEKLKEISKKVEKIREEILHDQDDEDNPDDVMLEESLSDEKPTKIVEVFNVLNTVSAQKRRHWKRLKAKEATVDTKLKRCRGKKRRKEDLTDDSIDNLNNKSRLERRLQQLNNDEKTLENVKHLQDSVRTERNPRVNHGPVKPFPNRIPEGQEITERNKIKEDLCITVPEQVIEMAVETPGEGIESSQCNNNIYYENEVTVEETAIENDCEYILYENDESQLLHSIDNNISYSIEYEDEGGPNRETNEFILLENLENMPVQIRATELATVNITPDNINPDLPIHNNQYENIAQNIEPEIEIIDESYNNTLNLENEGIYEIIETNNKKILPDKKFVKNIILQKDDYTKKKHTSKGKKPLKFTSLKRERPRKFNSDSKAHSETYSPEYGHDYEQNKFIVSGFGVDVENLEDSDHYLIVVDYDSENNELNISSCDEIGESVVGQDLITIDRHSREGKIVNDIQKLGKLKNILKSDVRKLRDIKNKLIKDIIVTKNISMGVANEA